MSNSTTAPDPFATAMQQLSAEAERSSIPSGPGQAIGAMNPAAISAAIDARFQQLEVTLSAKIDELARRVGPNRDRELMPQFLKIEEQLTAIRNSESVNHRLFDSLHDELLKYRDNFVHESLQKPFIHDLVHLFDDLSSLAGQLGTSAQEQKKRGNLAQWKDNLENAIHALVEILHRFDVKEVESREKVDRTLHRVINFEPTDFPEEDGLI